MNSFIGGKTGEAVLFLRVIVSIDGGGENLKAAGIDFREKSVGRTEGFVKVFEA